jgi:hypothetical protein
MTIFLDNGKASFPKKILNNANNMVKKMGYRIEMIIFVIQ